MTMMSKPSKPLSSTAEEYVRSPAAATAAWFPNDVHYFSPPSLFTPAPPPNYNYNINRQYFPIHLLHYYPTLPSNAYAVSVNPTKQAQFVDGYMQSFKFRHVTIPPRLRRAPKRPIFNHPSTKPVLKKWLPKKNQQPEISSVHPLSKEAKTTIMIRNIPNQIRRHELMEYLNQQISEQQKKSDSVVQIQFDFLYLPMDFRKHNNLGYAFVNFTNEAAAIRMTEILDKFKWPPCYRSGKICKIDWGRIQGKEALVSRFTNTEFHCRKSEYLPIVLLPPSGNGNSEFTTVGRCVAARVRV